MYTRQASGLVFYKADPAATRSQHKRKLLVILLCTVQVYGVLETLYLMHHVACLHSYASCYRDMAIPQGWGLLVSCTDPTLGKMKRGSSRLPIPICSLHQNQEEHTSRVAYGVGVVT